jgi:beta-lactamase class A
MITRRRFAQSASIAIVGGGLAATLRGARAANRLSETLPAEFAKIEQQVGGRLGVAVLEAMTGEQAGHRSDERFPLCSTFKLLAGAAILARVDAGQETLERRVRFETGDLIAYSPATEERVGEPGMTMAELCEAAITLSDNTAGNLLLAALGGPAGLTAFARSIGDPVTRLDRIEPELNEAKPGDERDTTTPAAMAANLKALILGDALSSRSKKRLTDWMIANKTGDARLRAGLPKDWLVGDKTGSGKRGSTNDVGLAWPPQQAPIIMTAYLTNSTAPSEARNAALAAVGLAIASGLERS